MKKLGLKNLFSAIAYLFYLSIIIIAFDVIVLNKILEYGHPKQYNKENTRRFPAPYVAFTGKPNVHDHNEFGFRGASFKEAGADDFKIAFFGGSTGYNGHPAIPATVEKELEKLLGRNVFVANYSVISSNHRQHLHGIIEFLPSFMPDLVVFYGGFNETILSAVYDPRPGYPYNYFYRSETSPFVKLLLKHSAVIGEIDQRLGIFSGLSELKKIQQPLSEDWNRRIVEKYFETLELANKVTATIESKRLGHTNFMAFYQPFQVSNDFSSAHNDIRKRIETLDYVTDVSSAYDGLGEEVYSDIVHVNQQTKDLMGLKIAEIIYSKFQKGEFEALQQ